MSSKECLVVRYVFWIDEETPTLMKGRSKQTTIKAWHYQNPPLRPRGRTAGFRGAIVGFNNLWLWPIFTLGPKARAEKGYSRGRVIKVRVVLRHSRG